MLRVLPVVLVIALEVYCVISVIVTPDDKVLYLPKIAWLLLVLLFPLVGSVAWLVAGRPREPRRPPRPTSAYPEYDRPGRAAGPTPESDDEFLRRVRERAEEQRRKAAEEKRAQEERDQGDDGAGRATDG